MFCKNFEQNKNSISTILINSPFSLPNQEKICNDERNYIIQDITLNPNVIHKEEINDNFLKSFYFDFEKILKENNIKNELLLKNEEKFKKKETEITIQTIFNLFLKIKNLFMKKENLLENENNFNNQEINMNNLEINKISINCNSSYAALLLTNNIIYIISTSNSKELFICKINPTSSINKKENIIDVIWHPLFYSKLLFITQNKLYIYTIKEIENLNNNDNYISNEDNNINKQKNIFNIWENLIYDKIIEISNNFNLVKAIYSYDGKFLFILGNSFIEIYDSLSYDLLYSKYFALKQNFKNLKIAENGSFFIVYNDKNIYLFNMFNFEFKAYTDFPGIINEIEINKKSNNIYIFITEDKNILLYILYNNNFDENNNFYYKKLNYSYNNSIQNYIHLHFKLFYYIYKIPFSSIIDDIIIKFSSNFDKLFILYNDHLNNLENQKNEIKRCTIFNFVEGLTLQQLVIYPISNIPNFHDLSINNYDIGFDYEIKKDFIIINYENKFIINSYIDFYFNNNI